MHLESDLEIDLLASLVLEEAEYVLPLRLETTLLFEVSFTQAVLEVSAELLELGVSEHLRSVDIVVIHDFAVSIGFVNALRGRSAD